MNRAILTLFLFVLSLHGASKGELSVYVLKNGLPLASQEVIVTPIPKDKNVTAEAESFLTDEDGNVFTRLKAPALYRIQLVSKVDNVVLAAAKKTVSILPEKQAQVIFSLKANESLAFMDVESAGGGIEEALVVDDTPKKKGAVLITIRSDEDKKPISGARVFVRGTAVDSKSDERGVVSLDIPEGKQVISIIHSEFSSQNTEVTVIAEETVMKEITLTPASMELEEFIVLAPQIEGSMAAMIAEVKQGEAIANVIGSAQMSKQGDSNAASALKRVPGITLIGGKYIYVRGLGDRYSSTELNGMPLPSPNPIKRTVPLDMFPSSVIGSLQVQKTFTPDITGAFGGGYVNVRTRGRVDEDHVKLKVGMNAHDSVGKETTTYDGSSSDWTGYDDSYRPFPDSFSNSALPVIGNAPPSLDLTNAELQTMLQNRDVDPKQTNVPYGKDIQMEIGKTFELGDEHELSLLGSYAYSTKSKLMTYTSYDYLISRDGVQSPDPDNTVTNDLYGTTIQHGGIFNFNYRYHDLELKYTKLYVLNTLDQTRDVNGTFGENNSKEHQYYFEWQERKLDIDQLSTGVDYDIGLENRFDIGGEYATASEYVPNDVYYNYRKRFTTKPYQFVQNDSKLTYNHRTTDDKLYNLFLRNKTMIPLLSEDDYFEMGYVLEHKEREGRRVELQMQSKIKDDDVIAGPISGVIGYTDPDDLSFSFTSQPKDQYDAELDKNAYYAKALVKPSDDIDISFGARYVDLRQTVDQFGTDQNVIVVEQNRLDFKKLLPSVGIKYVIDEDNQFRLAYSETFIYPDFREFVNTEFIHPVFLAKVSGNPDLKETDIKSIDARYEYYFNTVDTITGALFYKQMDNPIEDTQAFTTGTLPRFSFDNSKSAQLAGFELSWSKNLEFVDELLDQITLAGNYTYIYSKVQLTDEQKEKFVTQDRGLQGLSPQVFNLSLTYDNPDERSINLSYNKMDKRLMRVALKNGDVILGLDDYEIPPHLMDLTWIEKYESDMLGANLDVSFKVRNILDDKTIWKQGDYTTLEYKTGRAYSVSLSANF